MKTRKKGDTAVPKRRPELKSEIIKISKDYVPKTLYILANGCRYIEDDLEPQAEDYLESQDFYDLMQCYRIADQADQANVIMHFETVKGFIRERSAAKELLEALRGAKQALELFADGHNVSSEIAAAKEAIKKATL